MYMQIMFKGCIRAIIIFMNADLFCNYSVLFKAISLIYGLQSFCLALRPQNHTKAKQFSPHSWPSHSEEKQIITHTQYGDVLQAQMQVIKG